MPKIKLIHGHKSRFHPLYMRWWNMKRKCYDPNNKDYRNFGGIGIRMSNEWRYDFKAFATWIYDNIGVEKKGMILEREDLAGDFKPGNLKWIPYLDRRLPLRKENVSGVAGVTPTTAGSWRVRFTYRKQKYDCGTYLRLKDAINAKKDMINKLGLPL